MLVYEVNLEVDREIHAEYLAWLRPHVRELLALDGFEAARMYEDFYEADDSGRRSVVVQYLVRSEADLQAYFDQHAARFRADGVAQFGGRFSGRRRILRHVETWLPV